MTTCITYDLPPDSMFKAPTEGLGSEVMAAAPHSYVDAIRIGLDTAVQEQGQIQKALL